MRFEDLTHDGQVALAAWALLLKSEPPEELEAAGVPRGINRALGDICVTVGLRSRRKQHNNQRRADVNPGSIRKLKFTPGNQRRRPTKRKATV